MKFTRGAERLGAFFLAGLFGCASPHQGPSRQQVGESVVLVGTRPAALTFAPVTGKTVRIRSTYLPGSNTVEYLAGRDYVLNPAKATIQRTPNSRIPDFQTNRLYGQIEFDHSRFPGFGNTPFFAFVDYVYVPAEPWPVQPSQSRWLAATHQKLLTGQAVKIVAFGDSITAGGDATRPELIFWQRWAEELRHQYPRAIITALNGATGGDSTVQGLQRLQSKVLDERPDLVLIAFGMNDHNQGGVPVPEFSKNLHKMIACVRAESNAEVVLLSAFPPNPNWKFGSHHMVDYAIATERTAQEAGCAYADIYGNWVRLTARKKPEDLLGNNINHPNDFGHWIYFRVLCELGC